MDYYDFPKSRFYKAMMTGLFVGILVTIVCLLYNLVYRSSSGFPLTDVVNVSSLIFFTNIVFLIIGIVYYLFVKYFSRGNRIFEIVFFALTIFFVALTIFGHRTDDHQLNVEFRTLMTGIVIIQGLSAALLLPFLYHNKSFEQHVI